jgi:SAM-dependent methyltransferase
MFSASAEYYDLIYSTKKDYPAEAAWISALLRRLNPQCRTVLDVACGTGEHAKHLAAGFAVDGLDVDPDFVSIAERKHPAGRFFAADMRDFHLPHRYDAVICLFSSIGYLETLDRVAQALRCFREHLATGGVIVVEPWFAPGVLNPDRVFESEGESNGVRVRRTGRVEIDGRISRIRFEYDITDASGTRHATEVHLLGLFTQEEMLAAFCEAQLEVDYDPKGLTDRGLYVARAGG